MFRKKDTKDYLIATQDSDHRIETDDVRWNLLPRIKQAHSMPRLAGRLPVWLLDFLHFERFPNGKVTR